MACRPSPSFYPKRSAWIQESSMATPSLGFISNSYNLKAFKQLHWRAYWTWKLEHATTFWIIPYSTFPELCNESPIVSLLNFWQRQVSRPKLIYYHVSSQNGFSVILFLCASIPRIPSPSYLTAGGITFDSKVHFATSWSYYYKPRILLSNILILSFRNIILWNKCKSVLRRKVVNATFKLTKCFLQVTPDLSDLHDMRHECPGFH